DAGDAICAARGRLSLLQSVPFAHPPTAGGEPPAGGRRGPHATTGRVKEVLTSPPSPLIMRGPHSTNVRFAQVAELVDALASGASGGNSVEVRVLSWAPNTVR